MVKYLAFLNLCVGVWVYVCVFLIAEITYTLPSPVSPAPQPKTTVPRHTLQYCHPYPCSASQVADKTRYPLSCKNSIVCPYGGGGLTQVVQFSAQKGKTNTPPKFSAQ